MDIELFNFQVEFLFVLCYIEAKERLKMNKKDLQIDGLKNALATLKESWGIYQSDLDSTMKNIVADSCIQRYEYTTETSWKMMKRYLKLEYGKSDVELTINNIFRFMAGYGMIPNWENWKNYYAHRNDTSHEYNPEKARELLETIPGFIVDVEYLIASLEKALETE